MADRVSGSPPSQAPGTQVTVKEVSVATQSAVAQAVEMVGPLSSEVDVLMTAKSLLQQQTPLLAMDPTRPHSAGTTPPFDMTVPSAVPVPLAPPPISQAAAGGVYFPSS